MFNFKKQIAFLKSPEITGMMINSLARLLSAISVSYFVADKKGNRKYLCVYNTTYLQCNIYSRRNKNENLCILDGEIAVCNSSKNFTPVTLILCPDITAGEWQCENVPYAKGVYIYECHDQKKSNNKIKLSCPTRETWGTCNSLAITRFKFPQNWKECTNLKYCTRNWRTNETYCQFIQFLHHALTSLLG